MRSRSSILLLVTAGSRVVLYYYFIAAALSVSATCEGFSCHPVRKPVLSSLTKHPSSAFATAFGRPLTRRGCATVVVKLSAGDYFENVIATSPSIRNTVTSLFEIPKLAIATTTTTTTSFVDPAEAFAVGGYLIGPGLLLIPIGAAVVVATALTFLLLPYATELISPDIDPDDQFYIDEDDPI